MGDYFSQTSIIYFCLEFGCCPYYRGILKARADCTYFGRGNREAFKQDMFILMHLLLSSRGGSMGGFPIMACTRRLRRKAKYLSQT